MVLDKLLRGDIVLLFGSKVKLYIYDNYDIDDKITGINAKNKPIHFRKEQISKVIRERKVIYQLFEE